MTVLLPVFVILYLKLATDVEWFLEAMVILFYYTFLSDDAPYERSTEHFNTESGQNFQDRRDH